MLGEFSAVHVMFFGFLSQILLLDVSICSEIALLF